MLYLSDLFYENDKYKEKSYGLFVIVTGNDVSPYLCTVFFHYCYDLYNWKP